MGALSAVVSVAFGCRRSDAWDWLRGEMLTEALSPSERDFLGGDTTQELDAFQVPECLFTLAWAAGLIEGADDFASFVPDFLIQVVPHPPPQQGSIAEVRCRVRPVEGVRLIGALDLA